MCHLAPCLWYICYQSSWQLGFWIKWVTDPTQCQNSQPMQHGRSEIQWWKILLKIFSASSKVCHDRPKNDSKTRVLAWRGSYLVQLETLIQAISCCHGCFRASFNSNSHEQWVFSLSKIARRALPCHHPSKHHRISAVGKYLWDSEH